MQAYGAEFARIYNLRWRGLSELQAPRILEFFNGHSAAPSEPSILDLGCGTGQLLRHFLRNGFHGVGIDSSEHMLGYAEENCREYLTAGLAEFIQGDISDFSFDREFDLIVSIFDTMNHLPDYTSVESCIRCAHRACSRCFMFDMNTRKGLKNWNGIQVHDDDDIFMVTRGIYSESEERAYTRISGFQDSDDGKYVRFEETAFNTAFDMSRIFGIVSDAGWRKVYFARSDDLGTPIDKPEELGRVYIVALK